MRSALDWLKSRGCWRRKLRMLKGAAELDRKLQELGRIGAERVMRQAMRTGMNEAKAAATDAIPEGVDAHRTYRGRLVAPGFAKRSIRIVMVRDRQGGKMRAVLGVRREAFYATQFVELGTSKMPARPWLVPSFERSSSRVVEVMAKTLRERIERAAKGRK